MISLLAKFPWHSVQNYKLSTRNHIFNATREMLYILSNNLRKDSNRPRHPSLAEFDTPFRYGARVSDPNQSLTESLLHDLLSAGLNAPGFSETQRWDLYQTCDYARHHFLVSPLLQYWPFEVLCRKPHVDEDVVGVCCPRSP